MGKGSARFGWRAWAAAVAAGGESRAAWCFLLALCALVPCYPMPLIPFAMPIPSHPIPCPRPRRTTHARTHAPVHVALCPSFARSRSRSSILQCHPRPNVIGMPWRNTLYPHAHNTYTALFRRSLTRCLRREGRRGASASASAATGAAAANRTHSRFPLPNPTTKAAGSRCGDQAMSRHVVKPTVMAIVVMGSCHCHCHCQKASQRCPASTQDRPTSEPRSKLPKSPGHSLNGTLESDNRDQQGPVDSCKAKLFLPFAHTVLVRVRRGATKKR